MELACYPIRLMLVAVMAFAGAISCCCWRADAAAAEAAVQAASSSHCGECPSTQRADERTAPSPAQDHSECQCPKVVATGPEKDWTASTLHTLDLAALAAAPVLLLEVLEVRPSPVPFSNPPPLTAPQVLALHCCFLN